MVRLPNPVRLLIAAALAALALACPMTSEARADAAQATVVSPGGSQRPLSLEALAGSEDILGRAYALRSPAGESSQTVNGFSLAAILEAAGADPYGFSYLEVQRPAGGSVLLSRHQALDLDAFPDGPPVIYATASGTGFLRPSAGAEDLNATDTFEAPQGITIVLRKGSPLRVKVKSSVKQTRPGRTVHFEAIVERAGSGEQLAYSWYFDDGHSASGAEARHSFAERGSYDVVVGVTTPGDDVGASAVVTIQVGDPVGGPNRKGGGHNERADAPDHGAASGPSSGSPSAGSSGSTAAGETTPAPTSTPTPTPGQPQKAKSKPAPSGDAISGLLLEDPAETAVTTPPARQAAARTGSLDDNGGGAGLSTAAWGLLATAGLLGAGALIEIGGIGAMRARVLPGGLGR